MKSRKVFISIAAISLLGFASFSETFITPFQPKTVEAKTKKKKSKKKKTYSVGQTFKVGDVEYTVNSLSQTNTVGDEFLNETASGVFLLVNITIKNNGDEALSVSDDFFKLYKGKTESKSDSTAAIYANDDNSFFLEEINPGNSLTSNVVFDITPEVVSDPALQLQVQTGFWGTETGLVNLNK